MTPTCAGKPGPVTGPTPPWPPHSLRSPIHSSIRLHEDVTPAEWRKVISEAADQLCLPAVDARALNGLTFNAALPTRLAEATLAARLADLDGATAALRGPTGFTVLGQ
ncbi:MAG: ATP-dependent helicase Lhr and Lhr-like helicase [Streptomyces sp.]|nr:ATP-dependent helicase Lhr and Lhr-like helicase [Streptomyces sp.]